VSDEPAQEKQPDPVPDDNEESAHPAEETGSTAQATVPDEPAQEEKPDPVPDDNEAPDETTETMADDSAEHPGGEPPTVTTKDVAAEDTGGSEEEPLPSRAEDGEPLQDPAYRLIEDLEPKGSAAQLDELQGPVGALLKELDEQLAALPSGIALIDLPIVERRRIADRREELLSDRELLLEEKKRGAHRRGRRFQPKKQST